MDNDNQIRSTAPEQQDTAETHLTQNGQASINQNTQTDPIIDVIGNGQLTKKVYKIFQFYFSANRASQEII